MPLTPSVTGNLRGDGNWQPVASGGKVVATSFEPFRYATTMDATAPTSDVLGHETKLIGWDLAPGQHMWLRGRAGSVISVTAESPV